MGCQENITMPYIHTFVQFSVLQFEKTAPQFCLMEFFYVILDRMEPFRTLETVVHAMKIINLPAQKKARTLVLQREARYRFHQTKIFHEFLENSFYGCSRTSR